MKALIIALLTYLSASQGWAQNYQNGDLIFQKSQSRQSPAIEEATGSPWTHMGILFEDKGQWMVYEAVGPVKVTPLRRFILNGEDGHIVVKRISSKAVDLSNIRRQRALRQALAEFHGIRYDFWFEWSNDLIYCSELAYKGYLNAFNIEVGQIQQYRELRLDGPYVQRLIDERIRRTGRKLNLNELIITPVAVMDSPLLELVHNSHPD